MHPKLTKYFRVALFLLAIVILATPAFNVLLQMREITGTLLQTFFAIYPFLTASLLATGEFISYSLWQPTLFVFIQTSLFIIQRVFIPFLLTNILLDFISRLHPSTSFIKLTELMRLTLLTTVSIFIFFFSLFITFTNVVQPSAPAFISVPIKKWLQQNIPIVGSALTEGLSTFSSFTAQITSITGVGLTTIIISAVLLPSLKMAVVAFCYRLTAALIEPFAPDDLSDFVDDIGKTLFILLLVSLLIIVAIFYTVMFVFLYIKWITMMRGST